MLKLFWSEVFYVVVSLGFSILIIESLWDDLSYGFSKIGISWFDNFCYGFSSKGLESLLEVNDGD